MTPQQKCKWLVLKAFSELCGHYKAEPVYPLTEEDELFYDNHQSEKLAHTIEIVRRSGIRTGRDAPEILGYATTEYASEMPDGTWVSWIYVESLDSNHSEESWYAWIHYSKDALLEIINL